MCSWENAMYSEGMGREWQQLLALDTVEEVQQVFTRHTNTRVYVEESFVELKGFLNKNGDKFKWISYDYGQFEGIGL